MKPPTSTNQPRHIGTYLQQRYESIPRRRRHIMLAVTCLAWFLIVGAVSGAACLQHRNDDPEPETQAPIPQPAITGAFSTRMALSIMARQQGIMQNNTAPGAALQAGVVQKALAAHNAYHGAASHPGIQEYMANSTASAARLMTSAADDLTWWPLDRLSNGNAMLLLSGGGDDNPNNQLALASLRNTVHLNNVNDELGLWYWESYPGWSALDGMYSLGPFVALDYRRGTAGDDALLDGGSSSHDATAALATKAVLQFRLLWAHCRNDTTGLLAHGYDAGRQAPWAAGRAGGASGVVWGRGLGWFTMALVDTLELLSPGWDGGGGGDNNTPPPPGEFSDELLGMYRQLAQAVLRRADPDSGGWYQVVDMAGREGNYVESSATAMLAYALLKGARLGFLGPEDVDAATEAGRAAHALLARRFVSINDDGILDWDGTVAVCSLNSTATYDYYVNQPIVPNSPLGAAAFVMASVEVERLR